MSSPVEVGEILGGKFRVERVLGTGGMGVIVAAFHLQLEQHVALKFLLPDAAKDEAVVQRFAREARAAAKIQSEHVARVLDVGTLDTGAPYMVMEFLEGRDLDQTLKAGEAIPVADAVGYVMQACEAVAEAHALGIVHRDLKPANLFLADRADGKKSIKVLDFGISKVMPSAQPAEPSLTKTSAIMGSPMYMSPEQLRSSRDVDARADVWALGVVLYELLAASGPFSTGTVAEVCAAILKDPPLPLRTARADVPEALEAVIYRCLEKDMTKRYADIGELVVALRPFAPAGSEVSVERVASVLGNAALGQRGAPMSLRETSPEGTTGRVAPPVDRAQLELAATRPLRPTAAASIAAIESAKGSDPLAVAAPAGADPSATASAVSRSSWDARKVVTPPRKRGPIVAIVGVLLAAAVGGVFFITQRMNLNGTTASPNQDTAHPAITAPAEPTGAAAAPTTSAAPTAAASAAPSATAAEPEPEAAPSEAPTIDPHKLPWGKPRVSASASAAAAAAAAASAVPSAVPAATSAPSAAPAASASVKAGPAKATASPTAAPAVPKHK